MSREAVKRDFLTATLSVLIDVARRYDLPKEDLERILNAIDDEADQAT